VSRRGNERAGEHTHARTRNTPHEVDRTISLPRWNVTKSYKLLNLC
jgi:hypothetical protein